MATTNRHSTRDWRALCDSIIANQLHQTTTGALAGRPWAPTGYLGQLPSEYRQTITQDAPTYVVWSYDTPIAWLTSNERWVIPGTRYSVTTSAHQGVARVAIDRAVAQGVGSLGDEASDARARELHTRSLGVWDRDRPWAHGPLSDGGAR